MKDILHLLQGEKTTVTQEQHDNAVAAHAFLKEVPEGGFVRNLRDYECGSAFCLGGWLPYIPHFQKLGVWAADKGAPRMPGLPSCVQVGEALFGVYCMFSMQAPGIERGTAKEAALRRLQLVINQRIAP